MAKLEHAGFDFTDRPYIKAHAERTRAEIDWANNPHEFRVGSVRGGFLVVNREGDPIQPMRRYHSHAAAEAAICEMICDDEEDRRLNRHRHEQRGD